MFSSNHARRESRPVSTTTGTTQFARIGMTISANGGQEGSGILSGRVPATTNDAERVRHPARV